MATSRRAALTALLITATVALAGCSAGGGGSHDSAGNPGAGQEVEPRGPDGATRTDDDPQSTFALDVDTASYGYASRLIMDGRRPDAEEVRPEEFVNSFAQGYRQPTGDGFAIHADGARLPAGHRAADDGDTRLLRIGLQTRAGDAETRPDAALTFVVDVSGSMAEPGRLDLVQDALHTLVDQLRRGDSVAIVTFNATARVVLDPTPATDVETLHDAIDDLAAGGSTNLAAGLERGFDLAREAFRAGRTNRVIILSDGLPNVGATDATPILRRIRDEADKQIALLGVGVGSEYGDEFMEQLADRGDGFVVYVSERSQARDVFVKRLPATLAVRALDAKAQVTFDERTVTSYRLIGYENRAIADEDFRNDRSDGGEVGPGHSVTALYEVRLVDDDASPDARVARVDVRWQDPRTRQPSAASEEVTVADLAGGLDSATATLRVCYAAAYFAEALRGEPAVELRGLAEIAERAYEETGDPKVGELADLIERATELD